jgi:hypothetical protein
LFSNDQEGRSQLGGGVTERALRALLDQIADNQPLRARVEALERAGDCRPPGVAP